MLNLSLLPRFSALGRPYHHRVMPTPVREQLRLVHANPEAAALLGLRVETLATPEFLAFMSGNSVHPDYDPLASVYAGHQFGVFVPQLGDGRAITIAEVQGSDGQRWEMQLKGSGQTPFSRFADGRAVLRSSIREYLCSEAMHHLGIPTTRALALVASGDPVRRESIESAAVMCRLAPTHIRFGHFEYFYYHERFEALAPLADLVIEEHFPHLVGLENRYAVWLAEVAERTARLMAQWQAVGFCHGVMNTDNMSILGLTIDYGPFGFMDGFSARHICNHSDEQGRYAWDQQPSIGHWNVSRLLQATLPLLSLDPDEAAEIATGILNRFPPAYTGAAMNGWRAKLGFLDAHHGDRDLVNRFLNLLDAGKSDFTNSFRMLSQISTADGAPAPLLRNHLVAVEAFDQWLQDYRSRLRHEGVADDERAARMNAVNPCYVLRNHLVQRAIEMAESGDDSEVDRLYRLLSDPYKECPDMTEYAAEPPEHLRHLPVSCSS